MGELSSNFTREDIETLIEATGDWEAVGNSEYHVMNMIKNLPIPSEDSETYDLITQIKDHYKKREREINASRVVRQEKAIFLKAKLMLVRKDLGINKLFDMAAHSDAGPQSEHEDIVQDSDISDEAMEGTLRVPPTSEECKRLEMAEYFIKDLGVWDHYLKFLAEKQST